MTEMSHLLVTPLRDAEQGRSGTDEMAEETSTTPPCLNTGFPLTMESLCCLLIDLLSSVAFWYVLSFPFTDMQFNFGLAITALLMLLWRIYRVQARSPNESCGVEIPYTAACVQTHGKEFFLVATVHISPRAPLDVTALINNSKPDVAMIELDDERLDRMREAPAEQLGPKPEDLQLLTVTSHQNVGNPISIYSQRAIWNGEQASAIVSGDVTFNENDPYGLGTDLHSFNEPSRSHIALVLRGSPDGQFAPFALKAYHAARAGASGLLVINQEPKLPLGRIGTGTLTADLRVALQTCSCGFPSIPVLLLPKEEGNALLESCKSSSSSQRPRAEFKVRDDQFPRRTLARRLCQAGALVFSGIGILYGVIQCFSVEVGEEFLAAEIAARALGIPCRCIDVDLNRFWSRLGMALLPTPCNILKSTLSWLAFPRVCFNFLFPPTGSIDVLGSMFLHGASFPLKTWVAFILAGMCASFVTSNILRLLGNGAELGAEETGLVSEQDRMAAQEWIMLGIELYMLPQIYDAVAASRDEAMYQSIVAKCRQLHPRRMVVVVGAGHANGILQRVRSTGL